MDLGPLPGKLSLKPVDTGLGRGAVHGVGDLFGLAGVDSRKVVIALGPR